MTIRSPFRTVDEYAELVVTIRPRCLGCAAELPDERDDAGRLVWTQHGTCRPYYGIGERVDYDRWCELVGRLTDEPLFDRWASAEPMLGVPSWVPASELSSPADEVRTVDTALSGFGLLQAKAIANGHKLGMARIAELGGRRGFMARCQVAACGASIWEVADLAGGHGAGPLVLCPGK